MKKCPCCCQKLFQDCCEPFLKNKKIPATPEQLMRSRYTAYSMAKIDYIQKTMCKKAAENFDFMAAKKWARSVKWLRLVVLDAPETKTNIGTVTFIAYFKENNIEKNIFEKSLFEKIDGKWFYTHGSTPNTKSN